MIVLVLALVLTGSVQAVELGDWYRIGPFRDQVPLLNWMDNVESSFHYDFDVEKDALANGNVLLLKKSYSETNFPATPDAVRKWTKHTDWIDGYYQELPRGPAPSAGESQYLYRTITVDKETEIELDFIIRAPESDRRGGFGKGMTPKRRTGRYKCLLNGKEITRWDSGNHDMPLAKKVKLKKGVNHFFAKVTNNRHSYGFAFSITGMHPELRHQIGMEQMWRPHILDLTSEFPYYSEPVDSKLSYFVKRDNWLESFLASFEQLKKQSAQSEVLLGNFTGKEFPAGWKGEGSFGSAPRVPGKLFNRWTFADPVATSWEATDKHTGTGKLISPLFKITKKNLLLSFAGHCVRDMRFQLIGEDGEELGFCRRGHEREYRWSNWNVEKWIGKTVRLEIIDDQDKDGIGWLNIREIYMSDEPYSMLDREMIKLWKATELSAESMHERMNVLLLKQALEAAGLERVLASSEKNLRALTLKVAADRGFSLKEVASEKQNDLLYEDGLKRLRALKFYPHAMPGVESAAIDSKGRIVPTMEKELEKYPTSPAGDRHRARLAELEKIVKPLLKKIDETGKLERRKVLSAVKKLDAMWDATIRELPKLVYLERETYWYDVTQYVGAGTRDSIIKSFDPASRKIETIFDLRKGKGVRGANELNVSWDGKTIFIGGHNTVAAINSDGTGYRQIARGQSPVEMPDGRIAFFGIDVGISPCKATGPRMPLFISDSDGKNRKIVSANTCIDNAPAVMNDGRIIFTRWDYGVHKNVFNRHALWTQNPDGSGTDLYFGNTIIDPLTFGRPHQIPGRPEVLTIFAPHHSRLAGLLGLVWNAKGKEARDGLGFRRITHDTASVGDNPQIWSYQDPYPINEQLFLVTFGGRPNNKAGLYLYDRSGNRKCILESNSDKGIHSAQPFIAKKRPPKIPDRSVSRNWVPKVDLHERLLTDPDWTQKGTLMLQDVYLGIEPEIKRGQVKYIAVMQQTLSSHPRGGAIGFGTIWFVNRLLGLVPIEEDGSAHFEVPALRSLYFHVLDKDGKMLMTQGSDFHVMPGEKRSCIGCHEQRKGITSPSQSGKSPIAARKPPIRPKLPGWGTRGVIEYETVVQPVFDKYCVKCHSGEKPKGRLNLSGDRTTAFNMSYTQLTDGMYVHFTPGTGQTHAQPTNDLDEQAPLSRGSMLSKLTKYILDEKHCKKKIPFEDRLKVFIWIDSNVPFYSHYRQEPPAILSEDARTAMGEVHAKRCASCHDPKKFMPDERSGLRKDHVWRHSPWGTVGQWGVAESGMRVRHVNLSNPSHSAALQAPLSKEAGGWGLCGSKEEPVFKDKNDADYKVVLDSLKNGVVERTGIMIKGIKELIKERRN